MKAWKWWVWAASALAATAQTPENMVAEGVPPVPQELRADVGRYLEFRTASFQSWHPLRREMLITTRFADAAQLHWVSHPGGARRQLTFLPEPVAGGSVQPARGEYLVYAQDAGGGEFYQLYRFDPGRGRAILLTDGKSRNLGAVWARSGRQLAFTSTRRNGRDTDIWVMDPARPETARMALEVQGGGWQIADWSHDEQKLLLEEYISINESYLHLLELSSGRCELLTPKTGEKIAWNGGEFAPGDTAIYTTTDKDSEFMRLVRMDLRSRAVQVLTPQLAWDVTAFDLSPDGRTLAYVSNEDGASVLHLMDARSGRERRAPRLPLGVVSGLHWHESGREIGFTLSSARSPADAWSLELRSGRLIRWTESETGGLDASQFREPELVRFKSFDGLPLSAFVYRPDAQKFPGPRPALIIIHGGPEAQSRPVFQGRNNYYLDELGVTLVYPNVRGSSGYGKTFLTLDNGYKREDSVRDIGALLDWLRQDARVDSGRLAVMGGSYGGYMVLASMVHYSDRLRCGVDIVGISNFLTFLKNTQDYRRDLRRVEYGDERDPAMAAFLEKISPANHAARIRKPLLVVQGLNDPRVPASESEQMVAAIRQAGGTVWYLLAKDEGHGFAKKKNADYQFYVTILFLREFLLK
ncbi:MAG: prolyl oligopeptidase family serine peptidase [Verrucomicrobiae bacterium]|nr:prolyl oligopeptidase family serine peptidase [Verrucomicrobiae bacterium]